MHFFAFYRKVKAFPLELIYRGTRQFNFQFQNVKITKNNGNSKV